MTTPVEPRVRDLRLDRTALREEQARVGWWRRLVRARLDLAVASAARPRNLGEDVAFQLPLDVSLAVPGPRELCDVLPSSSNDLEHLDALRKLDARLEHYEQGVSDALCRATDRLIARLAVDPALTSDWIGEPLGGG
ncbi:hypothetical protein [Cellulomonas composti]|uniref:Uncharacterized protein n=1 Tax=Cellulomonas composti TaxID=266130 RepID=A0A511J7H2_9CELL|nr:hypothetical protein [Cellulomonas composti]GEL93938.1 hypothetical protein CCO02nite_05960 [Cellulomonas composti]